MNHEHYQNPDTLENPQLNGDALTFARIFQNLSADNRKEIRRYIDSLLADDRE